MDDVRSMIDDPADPGSIPSGLFVEPFTFGHHDVDLFRGMAVVRIDHARPEHAHADNNLIMPFEPAGCDDIGVGMSATKMRVLPVRGRTNMPMQERNQWYEHISQAGDGSGPFCGLANAAVRCRQASRVAGCAGVVPPATASESKIRWTAAGLSSALSKSIVAAVAASRRASMNSASGGSGHGIGGFIPA